MKHNPAMKAASHCDSHYRVDYSCRLADNLIAKYVEHSGRRMLPNRAATNHTTCSDGAGQKIDGISARTNGSGRGTRRVRGQQPVEGEYGNEGARITLTMLGGISASQLSWPVLRKYYCSADGTHETSGSRS